MKTKEVKLGTLIKEADEVFSKFIRYRDMKDGKVVCFICGDRIPFAEAQAMHLIDRDQMPTRYDEINVNGGCADCNCFDHKHRSRYWNKMIATHGIEVIDELSNKSRMLQKFMRFELQEIIDKYKILVAEMKKKL